MRSSWWRTKTRSYGQKVSSLGSLKNDVSRASNSESQSRVIEVLFDGALKLEDWLSIDFEGKFHYCFKTPSKIE